MRSESSGFLLQISGEVQGVGFRPFVWRLADELNLKGWVRNDCAGVQIAIQVQKDTLKRFITRLNAELPPLASISGIHYQPCNLTADHFEIVASQPGDISTGCVADAVTCRGRRRGADCGWRYQGGT